jgi:membrane protease YdiL (CAAX protease family)
MAEVVLVVGVAAQAILWRLVARRALPFWPTVTSTDASLGVLALATGSVACCAVVDPILAAIVGAASGLAFYGATRGVLELVSPRVGFVAGAVRMVYRRSEGIAPSGMWAVTLLLIVPGEELFWRGLVLPELQGATSTAIGVVLTWALAAGTAALWADVPFLAAAVAGGALWTGVGAWSGGVAAPLASHLVWTALMLAWPPSAAHGKVSA